MPAEASKHNAHPTAVNKSNNNIPHSQGNHERMLRYGFRMGRSGAHSSRTMMLDELQVLLDAAPADASKSDYTDLVVEAPVSCRRQLYDLSDDMATKVDIQFYQDARDALLKALVE